MKYLHLTNDEKFIDFAIDQFEKNNPGNNLFLIGTTNKNDEIKHILNKDKIIVEEVGSKRYNEVIAKGEFDVLVIHFLDYYKCQVILSLKNNPIIVWLAWGADIYNTNFYSKKIYQPFTENIIKELDLKRLRRLKIAYRKLSLLLSKWRKHSNLQQRAIRKIDYCATVIPDEFNILETWPFFRAKKTEFSYGSVEEHLKDLEIEDSYTSGNGIIVGNSIFPTSNHLDVFYQLQHLVADRNIIVPLNYGSPTNYRDAVIDIGKKIFGNRFRPVVDFLSKKEYVELLKECSIAIMNHDRQQGLGNIIILLWLGCKVFLSNRSILYHFLKRRGYTIYSVQDEMNKESISGKITPKQHSINRMLLLEDFGNQTVSKRTQSLINQIAEGCL